MGEPSPLGESEGGSVGAFVGAYPTHEQSSNSSDVHLNDDELMAVESVAVVEPT